MHRLYSLIIFVAFVLPAFGGLSASAVPVEPTSLGQAIVGFHPGAMPPLQAGSWFGGHEVLGAYPEAGFAVLAVTDLLPLRMHLLGDARVAYVEDDLPLYPMVTPNDPRWNSQYGPVMMGFPAAWERTFGHRDVIVAIIDSGVQRGHEDFDPDLMLLGYDYIRNTPDPIDDCGHGTHVAGTVGAWTDNGIGVAGMAQVQLLPMRVLSSGLIDCGGTTSNVARAIRDAADQGADVINLSLGGGSSTTLQNAADHAWNSGALVVAAAGNDGGCCVNAPASYASVIAVSALGSNKQIASYSSRGPQVEIAAPGSNILSTYPTHGYRALSGTSMASPHVAGALALALSWNPMLSNADLRQLLQESAEDLGSPGRDPSYGHGLARIDRLFDQVPLPLPGPDNMPPVVSFTTLIEGQTLTAVADVRDPDGDPLQLLWDLGDGTTRTDASIVHTYGTDGTYEVSLRADDGRGGWSLLTSEVTAALPHYPDPAPDIPALDAATWGSFEIAAGEERTYKFLHDRPTSLLQFRTNGPGCLVPGLPLPGILCDLDGELAMRHGAPPTDDAADCRADPQGSAAACTVHGPETGWWFVRFKATEGAGTVQVRADPIGEPEPRRPDNAAPRVLWGYEAYGREVGFRSDWVTDRDDDPLTFHWDLGDGSTSTLPGPVHTYANEGDHDVVLTVSDGRGGTTSLSGIVTVQDAPDNDPPVAVFSWAADGLEVLFDGSDSYDPEGDDLTYHWDLGDGGSAIGRTVHHTYPTAGTYPVTLTVRDGHGAPGRVTHGVTVQAPVDPAPGIPNLENGVPRSLEVAASEQHPFKVLVPPGKAHLVVELSGANCGLLGCPHDVDLAVRHGAEVTDEEADCRRDTDDANAFCVLSAPQEGWWYLRIEGASGSGQVSVTASWPS